MEVLILMLPIALLLGLCFVIAFIWSVRKGQYDDLETPAYKMLLDDDNIDEIVKININNKKG